MADRSIWTLGVDTIAVVINGLRCDGDQSHTLFDKEAIQKQQTYGVCMAGIAFVES